MILYFTGASTSSAKSSNENPQTDVAKSLGGYISTSPVPNGAINEVFDCISLTTLKTKPKETLGFGLVNKFDTAVKNLYIRIITPPDAVAKFRVAAVAVGDDMVMEHIPNRYAEPVNAEFTDITYIKAFVDFEIENPVSVGEDIYFEQFDVLAEITEPEIEGNVKALIRAFSNSRDYELKRLSEKRFRVISKDDTMAVEPFTPSYLSSDENARYKFLGEFKLSENTAFLTEILEPGKAIGIWLQRDITEIKPRTNEEILNDDREHRIIETVEEIELVIDYDDYVEEKPYLELQPTSVSIKGNDCEEIVNVRSNREWFLS